jgi:hypothetical protein
MAFIGLQPGTTSEITTIGGVAITSTAAELNILDGVTSTAAELNILDGVTSTAAELNLVDGSSAATVVNSKAVIYGSSGEVKGTTFQTATNTSGNLLIANGTGFASTAVGDLSEISSVASDDVLLAIDTSGGGLKRITRQNLVAGLAASSALSNVVEDTSPQLGGDLDVNGNGLVSTSNGNITITPNGTGLVRLDGNVDIQSGEIVLKNSGSVSNIKFYCEVSNAHYTQLQSAAHSAYSGNITLTLPIVTGTLIGSDSNGVVTFDKATVGKSTAITSSSNAATLNLQLGDNFTHTLSENVTYTFSNPGASGKPTIFSLKVTQDSTARTITWPSSVDWAAATAPTLTATSGGVDVFVFITYDGGTTYYGFTAGQAMG